MTFEILKYFFYLQYNFKIKISVFHSELLEVYLRIYFLTYFM